MTSFQGPEVIFIVGNSRSGTTLMSKILGNHPEVFSFHELHFYERLWTPEENKKTLGREEIICLGAKLLSLEREQTHDVHHQANYYHEAERMLHDDLDATIGCPEVYRSFLRYETRRQGRRTACEQTPRNIYYLSEILQQFPNSRILHMVRDPRDVLLSQKSKWRRKGFSIRERLRRWANYHPLIVSKMWSSAQRAVERFSGHPSVLTVRFEDLVSQPRTTVPHICNFLHIEYEPAMLEVASSKSPTREKDELSDTNKGISAKPIGRWRKRLSRVDTYWCEKINREQMKHYGYDLSSLSPTWVEKGFSLALLPAKTFLAIVLNIGNTSNFVVSIKRRFLVKN